MKFWNETGDWDIDSTCAVVGIHDDDYDTVPAGSTKTHCTRIMPPQGWPTLSSSFVVPWWRRTTTYDIPEPPLEDENHDPIMGDHQPVMDKNHAVLVVPSKPKDGGVVDGRDHHAGFLLCGIVDHYGCWNLCWDHVNHGGGAGGIAHSRIDDIATLTPETDSSEEIREDPPAATVDRNNNKNPDDKEVEEESHLETVDDPPTTTNIILVNKSTSPTGKKLQEGDSPKNDENETRTTMASSSDGVTSDEGCNLDDTQPRVERNLSLTGEDGPGDGGCEAVGTALVSNVVVMGSLGVGLATREHGEPAQVPSPDATSRSSVTPVILEIHSATRENNNHEATEQAVELLDQQSILGSFEEPAGGGGDYSMTLAHDYYVVASNTGSSSFNVSMNPYEDDNQGELGKGENCKCHAPTCKVM